MKNCYFYIEINIFNWNKINLTLFLYSKLKWDGLEKIIRKPRDEPMRVPGFRDKVHTHANPTQIHSNPTNPILTLNVNVFQNIQEYFNVEKSDVFELQSYK